MKGIGWIVMLLGLVGTAYLVARDLGALQGERQGQAVLEPLERANETAKLIRDTQNTIRENLEKSER